MGKMKEYYTLRFKSSPEKVSYILYKSEKNLEIIGSQIPPEKMGIKLEKSGNLYVPKYFFTPSRISKESAFEILLNQDKLNIEALIERF